MGTKQIYLPDELIIKLMSVENVSGLIASLLQEHFRKEVKPNLQEISKELSEVEERKKILEDKKTEVIVETKALALAERQTAEREENKAQVKMNSVRSSAKGWFPDFARLTLDEQDKLLVEYLSQDDLNIMQFFTNKGFKDNLPEDG